MITNYALWYIEQVDGIEALTRDEIMDNLNALYGVPASTLDVTIDDLREELRFQVDKDWQLDQPLMDEILYWRCKNADIDTNEDAEYAAGGWALYGDVVNLKMFQDTDLNETDGWRLVSTMFSFSFEAFYCSYIRYPLIDAARIEAQ